MSLDRQLIDAIKGHFARKTSAQLSQVIQSRDEDTWSPEAVAAAGELLDDRQAGRAVEPLVGEEDRPPPPQHLDGLSLAYLFGMGSFAGLAGLAFVRGVLLPDDTETDHDLPMPFGPNLAWLALDTTNTAQAAAALGLQDARPASWAEGIEAAYHASVYITPPLADWTLAVGTPLFPPDRADAFAKPLLERLSQQFGEAQYFANLRDAELLIWARARKGKLVRGYGWLGQKGLTLWDEGKISADERDAALAPATADLTAAEIRLLHLASRWSIDPTTLDENYKEPVRGLLGKGSPRGRIFPV